MSSRTRASPWADTTPEELLAIGRLDALARLMDHAFRLPGTQIRFGLDAILGLIPGIGDLVTNMVAGYLVLEGRRLGVSNWDMTRMIGNIAVDALLAAAPVVGDIFDIFWQASDRNMRILRAHLLRRGRIIDGEAVRIYDR
ncbi:MAG: DUF4112 domain-containing protein [Alphaproteobacteria bacterium]|nr:DUF4112 domain-containing protein [Alphaproteobacteria bacterium]